MTYQYNVVQIFPDHQVGDIRNMGVRAFNSVNQVAAFGQSGQGRRKEGVTTRLQKLDNRSPTPAAMLAAMNQNKNRQIGPLLCLSGLIALGHHFATRSFGQVIAKLEKLGKKIVLSGRGQIVLEKRTTGAARPNADLAANHQNMIVTP